MIYFNMDGEKTDMHERHTKKALYVCTGMFNAAKFLIAQRFKKSQMSPVNEQISKI